MNKPQTVNGSAIRVNCTTAHQVSSDAKPRTRNCVRATEFAMIMRPHVFSLMVQGIKGPTALAKALNERHVPSRFGKTWSTVTVHRLLRRLGPSLIKDVKAAQAGDMAQAMKNFGFK